MITDKSVLSDRQIPSDGKKLQATSGRCFLCNSTQGRHVMQEGNYVALRCDCGLTFIDPAPDDSAVDPCLDPHHRVYYSGPARARAKWVKKFKDKGLLLDVGCGEGEFAQAAIAQGFIVEGMEPLESRAKHTENSLGIKIHRSFIENNTLQENRYDVVFHVDMLSHFPDPIRSLEAMRKLAKSDGVICFEVGLHETLSPFWRRFSGRGNMPAHRWFYDSQAVKHTLDRAGFELIAMRRYDIGLSNILSKMLLTTFKPDVISGKSGMTVRPMATGPAASLYYRCHMWLRYICGRWAPLCGPKTAFVAAIPKG